MRNRIIKVGHKNSEILTTPCDPVTEDESMDLINEMIHRTFYLRNDSVGVAGNQVGLNKLIFTAKINGIWRYFINPTLLGGRYVHDVPKVDGGESCLSIPNMAVVVPRYRNIRIEYLDLLYLPVEMDLHGFDARVVQHELDHLDGILITDHLEDKLWSKGEPYEEE